MNIAIWTSFRQRLLIGLLLISMSVALGAAAVLFIVFEENEREEAQAWMQATIVQVANLIDADRYRLNEVHAERTAADVESLREILVSARTALVRELDTAVGEPVADETIVNLAVMVPSDSDDRALTVAAINRGEIGQYHDMSVSDERRAGWQKLSVEGRARVYSPRKVMRAYVPIRDAAGNPVGVVRLDADQRYFNALIIWAFIAALLVFFGGAVISLIFTWRFSRAMARPLESLMTGMEAVAAGTLDTEIELPGTGDEFDRVSQRFNQMVVDLRDRARLKRDMGTAAAIQQHLLPHDQPSVEGYDVFGGARYCDESGGDYFDFFQIDDAGSVAVQEQVTRFGFVVADVSGHGLGAALRMTAMRAVLLSSMHTMREHFIRAIQDVNDQLVRDSQTGSFVTAFAAGIDLQHHTMKWTSAGHDPALVIRHGVNDVERLNATSIPLGIGSDAIALGDEILLHPGDTVVVGTDGVSQCRDRSGRFFGFERMAAIVREHPHASAEAIWHRIMDAVIEHLDGEPHDDDMTLVVVRRQVGRDT
ncbi:MAG: SpoIIE family protein phosphatase [Planctomycetota bacterium]